MNTEENLLAFSTEDANRVFDELKNLGVELDPDPLIYGPKRLNQKVSELRAATGRTERLFLELAQRRHLVQRTLTLSMAELEMAKKDLFANDPETRAGRSVSDREAIAHGKLRDEIIAQRSLELALQSLDAVLIVVKTTRSDLRDTQGRLKDQVRLCMEEIGLGDSWGSKVPHAPALNPYAVTTPAAFASIGQLLSQVDGEIHPGIGIDSDEEDDDEPTGFTEPPPEVINVDMVVGPLIIEPTIEVEEPVLESAIQDAGSLALPETTGSLYVEEDGEDEDGISGLSDLGDDDFTDTPVDQGDVLPSTAPAIEVHTFLEDFPDDLMAPQDSSKPTVQMTVDSDLDDILNSFEETI